MEKIELTMEDIQKRVTSSKVLKAVGDIEREKEAAKRIPTHALLNELKSRTGLPGETIWAALDNLKERDFVEVGRTINDYWIRLKK